MTDVPHFAFPFRFERGRAVEVEQDTTGDIAACVEAILRCPLGHRDERPDFGIPDQAFLQGGANLEDLRSRLIELEPRADADLSADEVADLAQRVTVTVRRG